MDQKLFESLLNLQEEIHATNVSKGFWPADRNEGEAACLIATELAEAVEGHRESKTYVYDKVDNYYLTSKSDEMFALNFKVHVKNSVQDEFADAVIRLLDYCGGFKRPLVNRDYRKQSTGNFTHDVFRIIKYCCDAYDGSEYHDWGYVLASIAAICEWNNYDLLQHVQWKMRYNKTRPFKHGKQF